MNLFDSLEQWLTYCGQNHPIEIDLGLERMAQVKDKLNIHFSCPVITVAGTNGKGSTCSFLAAILQAGRYKVACHTSPHLYLFNERAVINCTPATDEQLIEQFEAVEAARKQFDPIVTLTYFEFTTLAILRFFQLAQPDVVILEVGLGGRLDAINTIDADCAVITSIAIDHTEHLGHTREAISLEKAGIFRPHRPAIIGDKAPPKSLLQYAQRHNVPLRIAGIDFNWAISADIHQRQWQYKSAMQTKGGLAWPALRGDKQLQNASTAIAALETLHSVLPLNAQALRIGLAKATIPGRFQVLTGQPTVVLDVAHNPEAAKVLADNLLTLGFFPKTYGILGMMVDKDIEKFVLALRDEIDYWLLTALPTARAAQPAVLQNILLNLGITTNRIIGLFTSPQDALKRARELAQPAERIVVFGSFYTVAGIAINI